MYALIPLHVIMHATSQPCHTIRSDSLAVAPNVGAAPGCISKPPWLIEGLFSLLSFALFHVSHTNDYGVEA